MQEKTCSKCKETKPVSEFNKNKTEKDGLRANCRVCHKLCEKDLYTRNKQKLIAKSREYRIKNPKAVREAKIRWDKENLLRRKELHQAWKAKNKQRVKELSRRAHHKRRAVVYIPYDFNQAYAEYKGICVVCQEPVPRYEATVEHLYPLSKGGKDVLANVGPSHEVCNKQKFTKIMSFKHVPRDTSARPDAALIEV